MNRDPSDQPTAAPWIYATYQVDTVLEFVYFRSEKFGGAITTEVTRVRRSTGQMYGVDPAVHLRLRISLYTVTRQRWISGR